MTPDGELEVGDHAVYPVHGVVKVARVEEKDIGGTRQRFYVLVILDLERKIFVPIANAAAVGLRALATPALIDEARSHIADEPGPIELETWNRRARVFAERIKTGDLMEIADILRELGWLRTRKTLSYGEKRTYEATHGLFVKELAIALGVPEASVRDELDALFVPRSTAS